MVTRDTPWPAGTPCWVDLGVDDIARARAFYSALFGWQIPAGPAEAGGYSIGEVNGGQVAGIGPKMGPAGMPTVWTTYLATDDADETAERIAAAGGHLIIEPFDVMDAGRMAMASDPGGAVFGIWQAGAHIGAQLANTPGTLIWNENMSRSFDGNKAFYRAVFGCTYSDIAAGDFRYATIDLDGRTVGGIGEIGAGQPPEAPAHWSAYFAVDDTDAAVAKVTHLGGSVIAPPRDTPYGRMAVVSDDQGGVFSVMAATADGQA